MKGAEASRGIVVVEQDISAFARRVGDFIFWVKWQILTRDVVSGALVEDKQQIHVGMFLPSGIISEYYQASLGPST